MKVMIFLFFHLNVFLINFYWSMVALQCRVSFSVSSVTHLCPNLCDPVDCSTPGFPVHHQLPELAQTHIHGVSDAIQASHPLSSPSPPAQLVSTEQQNESATHIHISSPFWTSFP